MKKGTLKEVGKLLFDFAKIGGAVAIITPLVQGKRVSDIAFLIIGILIVMGIVFIDIGEKDE